MKRSLRLTLTLIAVLVLAMSVMVISAGAVTPPLTSAPTPTLTNATTVDGAVITVVSPGVYSYTYANDNAIIAGVTYNPTVNVVAAENDYIFGAATTAQTPITALLVTTSGDASVQGTITIPWEYTGSTVYDTKTGTLTIAITRNVNDTYTYSGTTPVTLSPTNAIQFDIDTYIANQVKSNIATTGTTIYAVTNGVGSINGNNYVYNYTGASQAANAGEITVTTKGCKDGVYDTTIGTAVININPPALSLPAISYNGTTLTISGNAASASYALTGTTVSYNNLAAFSFTDSYSALYLEGIYKTNTGGNLSNKMSTSDTATITGGRATFYAKLIYNWPYTVQASGESIIVTITVNATTGTPAFSTYAQNNNTAINATNGTISISPTSSTSVELAQYLSIPSGASVSYNMTNSIGSMSSSYYQYAYNNSQAQSVGTVRATVTYYENGNTRTKDFVFTITPPTLSSNLSFNSSALTISGSNTASATYSTSSSSITRTALGNLFSSSPSAAYTLNGIYTTETGNTLIDSTYAISGTSYVYARLTTNWPYTTSSKTVTVTLTIKSTSSTYTPKNETNKVTVAEGATHTFSIAQMFTNYINTNFNNSNKTTSNYEFKITGVGSSYGQAYYRTSNSGTKTKLSTSTTLTYSQISNGYFTYDADDASGTKYDTITFSILYNNEVIHSGLKMYVYVGDGDGSYKAENFSISYKSSASSVSFTKSNFTSHYVTSTGSTSNVPDIDYVVFTSLPATKYGILYNGSERSSNAVDTSDKIDYADLGSLQFVFGDSFTDGITLKYYIVDEDGNKSGTATITITNKNTAPVVYDYAVGVLSNKTYTFEKSDFTDAYYDANGDSLSSIKIISLPSEGTLYLSNSKVSVGETISASNLSKLKYEPDGSNYRDTFTWQAYDGTNYSPMSANMQVIVFKSSISSIGGDMTVYLSDDEYSFSSDDFKRVYVTDDYDNYKLEKIRITSLPSDGTLYLGTEKSSNAVKKGDELTLSNMNSLLYVADKGFKKDDFEYIVYDGDSWSSSSNYGVVTIKAGYDTTGGYSYTRSGSAMTLTFDKQATDSGKVTGTLSESDITALVKEANTGTTLIVYLPSSSSADTRSLVIDDVLFTVDNVKVISKIRLMDTDSSSGSAGYIELGTAAVSAQYSRSTSDFTLSLTSVTPSGALSSYYGAGNMRIVDMKIGSTSITGFSSVGSAILALPYSAASSQSDMAVILRASSASSSSAAPVVSSKYYSSLSQLTADISLLGSGTYLAGTNVKSFSDMYSSLWDYTYVMNLAARDVIDGYPQGTYQNNKDVKRSEYIKLLVESFGLYNAGASCQFTDLPANSWYYTYVASAVKNGILTDGGAFNGDDPITRDDMALYSYRAAQAAGITLSTNRSATTFTDQNAIGSVYTAAIQALQRAGIIDGYTNGSYLPKGRTDRGEAAKVIRLLLDQYYSYN